MEAHNLSFRQNALTKIMSLLKHKFPVGQYSYFDNLKDFDSCSEALYQEISYNYINLSERKKSAYAHHLLDELSSVPFQYDPAFIELKLKKYNETYSSFPYFVDPVLRSRLQYPLSELRAQDVLSEKDLGDYVIIKNLQSYFLQFALEMKLHKILGYVRRKFDLDASEKQNGIKEHTVDLFNGKKACRYYEKTLFSIFQEQFSPQNAQERLLTPLHLDQQLSKQLKTIQTVAKGMRDEIKDNLISIPFQNCLLYLKYLRSEFTTLQYSLNNLYEDYLKCDPANFECPGLGVQIENRPDLHSGIAQIVGLKLQKVDSLLEFVTDRLNENMEISASKGTQLTVRLLVNIFDIMGFFKVKLMTTASNVEKADFMSKLFGLNSKNLKSEIEKLGLKSSQTNSHFKADVNRAKEFVKSIFKTYKK